MNARSLQCDRLNQNSEISSIEAQKTNSNLCNEECKDEVFLINRSQQWIAEN
ncbi:MAG TPA: hypothetical protein VL134_07615 [Leptolyngbya sp.]|nr:hypothetical protein [Leptolyngbya sp.]